MKGCTILFTRGIRLDYRIMLLKTSRHCNICADHSDSLLILVISDSSVHFCPLLDCWVFGS